MHEYTGRTIITIFAGLMKRNCNIPFAPASFPVFYGWIILAAGTIGMLMSIPGQTMGVSVFTDKLIRDLAVDRSNLSLAYFFGTLSSGLMITRAGKVTLFWGSMGGFRGQRRKPFL